ncbi:MAG: hypothetical protein ACYTGG_09425 [Planctomycetota bacterium]|jgi:hypothetical protein
MRTTVATLAIAIAGIGAVRAAESPPAETPVGVFADLDGTWSGVFIGYDERGRELYRIRVTQTYATVDATTQTVRIRDEMPDGTIITGRGRNTAERLPDGRLRLQCVVEKSNGDRVEHDGRVVRGPGGEEQIIWHSADGDRIETFRESVRQEADGPVYEINGMGRYDGSMILMHGRYHRRPAAPDP